MESNYLKWKSRNDEKETEKYFIVEEKYVKENIDEVKPKKEEVPKTSALPLSFPQRLLKTKLDKQLGKFLKAFQ